VTHAATRPERPRWMRWAWVVAASMLINTSYGTLSYAFSVLVTQSGPGGEFGKGAVSIGFGLALLVSGVIAIATGAVADLFGTRRLMAAGSAVGALGLCLLAACQSTWQMLVVMVVLIGPAMAATFYEPIYVLMNRWFSADERPRAYGVLTLLSGFSVTIFTPLTRWLVAELGWREAVVVLGGVLLAVGLVVAALIREEMPVVTARQRHSPATFLLETRDGLRHTTKAFWAFTLSFFVATTAMSGFSFHMISQLETRGFDETSVASAIAITGIVSLPARFLLPLLSVRLPGAVLLAFALVLVGTGAWVASMADEWWQVWVYIAVFGAAFGAVYPLRALVTAERFAGPYFGRVIGIQALFVALGRAAGPVVIGAIGTDQASYEVGFRIAAVTLAITAFACWWTMRRRRGTGHVVAA